MMLKGVRASMWGGRQLMSVFKSPLDSPLSFSRPFNTLQLTFKTQSITPLNNAKTLYGGVCGSNNLSSVVSCHGNLNQVRFYRSSRVSRNHTDEDKEAAERGSSSSPELMKFPWVIWPSLWHTLRNWIFAKLIIHRYLDQEFDMTSFSKGALQAVVYVSHELSKGNFEALEDLVTSSSLMEIKKNFAKFSLKQRLDLAIDKEDIFFSFPYQIGMIFTNEGSSTERIFVEITMCYHIFRGLQDHINSTEPSVRGVYDQKDRISIANYRFIREFTKGVVDDWTISLANHFKPGENLKPGL